MPKKFYLINKKEGETPLEALEVFRLKCKIDKSVPMTYAGRLDPMASGLLLILTGEECKNKEKYLNLDKEYEFQILFGFSTDTYDILGKVLQTAPKALSGENLEKLIKKNLKFFRGEIIQKYPMYSSKTVAGKPLFSYARNDEEVVVPSRKVTIKNLKYLGVKRISSKSLLQNIEKRVNRVDGDFRQKAILKIWKKELSDAKMLRHFCVASFKTKCSSGTYVRTIANDLGVKINIPALAFSIKRTKIGKYNFLNKSNKKI